MSPARLLLAVCAALALPGGALAAEDAPLDFEVQEAVRAAMTGDADPEALIRRAGKPNADYVFRALAGEIDMFVQKQDNGAVAQLLLRGERTKRRVVDLRALEWRGTDCACSAILLFKGTRFIYAMLPVSGSEDSTKDLKNRYADRPAILELAGPGTRARMFAYPDRGVGYVATGPGPFAFKVIFPKNTRASAFRGAITGLPAPSRGSNIRSPGLVSPPATPPPVRKPRGAGRAR